MCMFTENTVRTKPAGKQLREAWKSYQDHDTALSKHSAEKDFPDAPFDEEQHAAASYVPQGFAQNSLTKVMDSIRSEGMTPNTTAKQSLTYLQIV